jgi:tripartite ATP-independent transporter DctM subunit
MERLASLRHCWGIVLIAVVVLGGIYSGFFSVTEAGAAGAFLAFFMTLFSGGLTWHAFKGVLLRSVKTSVMILFIVVGIMMFTHFLTLSRMPSVISKFLIGLPVHPVILIILILAFFLFLGMFFDAISMMALTLPLLFSTIVSLGYDPIWFGILCILMCEVGLITPPVGINCYVVHSSIPDIGLEQVFKGVIPFVIANIIAAIIMIAFPKIVTFLPGLIAG